MASAYVDPSRGTITCDCMRIFSFHFPRTFSILCSSLYKDCEEKRRQMRQIDCTSYTSTKERAQAVPAALQMPCGTGRHWRPAADRTSERATPPASPSPTPVLQ